MLMYRVRFTEAFKDGTIFGSRAFKANEVAVISESETNRARQSGAAFDILETLIPNPLKGLLPYEPEQVIVTGTFTDDPINQNVISPVVSSTLDDVRPQVAVVLDSQPAKKKAKKNEKG